MTVLRFLFRNWPLKIAALLMATILYGGMVVLGTAGTWPNQVPIDFVNRPSNAVLLDPLPTVKQVRYLAPNDVTVGRSSFTARVDLAHVNPSETEPVLVNVELTANDQRIQILDYDPQQVSIRLDPIISRTLPVQVKYNAPPSGLDIGDVVLSQKQVNVFGAASYVRRVAAAEATVAIEPSGLDVDQNVDLVAFDADGNPVDRVEFDPRSVHVTIQVGTQLRTASVPVLQNVTGSPAAGYAIASVEFDPPLVDVRGEASVLSTLHGVQTKAISVAGATSDVRVNAPLLLPSGVEAPGISTVGVVIHVQALAGTRTVSVGVVPDGARSDRIYALSTTSVTLTLGGPLAALNALDYQSLVATVSVGNLDAGSHRVKVAVGVPAGITYSVSPPQIDVTVSAPPSPTPAPTPAPTPSATPAPSPTAS